MKLFCTALALLFLIACGDDRPDAGPPKKDMGIADQGVEDIGGEGPDGGDATVTAPDGGDAMTFPDAEADGGDAGFPDADGFPDGNACEGLDAAEGIDRGPPAVHGPCATNTEGCVCSSTITGQPLPFRQESCEMGMVCVHWDDLSGLTVGMQLEGPVKSCVRPCTDHAECGANRYCMPIGFDPAATGVDKICVDRIAGYDEACSGSRVASEEIVDPNVSDLADDLVACEPGLTCLITTFPGSFNPDEGLCAAFCETDTDCCGRPDLPYCNARFFATADPNDPFIGVCTDGRHPNGALCGSPDPNKLFRVSTACDTGDQSCGMTAEGCPVCVGINLDQNNSLTPDGMGICMSPCSAATPCFAGGTCVPNFFANGDGVCSDGCTAIPETCTGAGSLNNGQDCLELAGGASFCTDRYLPALTPSTFSNGMPTSPGDNCIGTLDQFSFFRCPEYTTCVPVEATLGLCIHGCRANDAMYGDTYCQMILGSMTAICNEIQADVAVCEG